MGTHITREVRCLDAIIPNGQSESNAIDISGGVILALQMPDAWTTAALSFLGSVDGTNFYPVYDDYGTEVTVASGNVPVNGGRVITNSQQLEKLAALRAIKLRSGVNGAAVAQGAERRWKVGVKG